MCLVFIYFLQQEAASKRKRASAGGSKGRLSSGDAKKRKTSSSGPLSPAPVSHGGALLGSAEDEVEAADLLFSAESFEELRASANLDDSGSDDEGLNMI